MVPCAKKMYCLAIKAVYLKRCRFFVPSASLKPFAMFLPTYLVATIPALFSLIGLGLADYNHSAVSRCVRIVLPLLSGQCFTCEY